MKTKQQGSVLRYSISFKQKVVKALEEGSSFGHLTRKYGLGNSTLSNWVFQFGKNHLLTKIVRVETMNERDRLKQLEAENKKLKIALADAYMAKDCLETVISMANEEYKTDLKKNFGDQDSKDLSNNTASKDYAASLRSAGKAITKHKSEK